MPLDELLRDVAAPVGVGLVIGVLVSSFGIWLGGWICGRRDDGFRPIDRDTPPPPHVSPFASPRRDGATSRPPRAEGEVKP